MGKKGNKKDCLILKKINMKKDNILDDLLG
jgi:hypothetical protein